MLYYSITLSATVAVVFALFTRATPSNINLFDKNRDVGNWLFIAATASLAYITLSAFIMFYILISKSTRKLDSSSNYVSNNVTKECVNANPVAHRLQQKNKANVGSSLLRFCNVTNSLPIDSIANTNHLDDKDIIVQLNKEYFNTQYNQEDSLSSSIYGYIPSSQLHLNQETNNLIKIDERASSKSGMIDKVQEQRYQMYVPEHIYLSM